MTIDEPHDHRRKNIGRTRNEQDNPIRRMHPLRRNGGHILRDLPILRIQTGRTQPATKEETYELTQATTD